MRDPAVRLDVRARLREGPPLVLVSAASKELARVLSEVRPLSALSNLDPHSIGKFAPRSGVGTGEVAFPRLGSARSLEARWAD